MLADALLAQQSWGSFEAVARPKLAGALALHQLTAGEHLELFVMFSSAAALLGSAAQANYAAANAMMKSIARARRARGELALCVEWGPWTEGMAAKDKVRQRLVGLTPMEPQTGFALLHGLLQSGMSEACVLPVTDWVCLLEGLSSGNSDPFLAGVRSTSVEARQADGNILERLRSASPPARRRLLLDHLREQVQRVLGPDPLDPVDTAIPLRDRGLDFLMSVELRNLLAKSLRRPLSSTLVLDYPSLDALCDHLLGDGFAGPNHIEVSDDPASIAALSDDEAEILLRKELEILDV